MKEQKPKYNQGDILGYRHILYVITRVEGDHYAGFITGKNTTEELNNTKDIDNNKNIRLVARG